MPTSPKPSEDYIRRRRRQMIELRPAEPRKLSLKRRAVNFLITAAVLPIVWSYRGLVGWWLDPISARHFENKLKEKVRNDLAFLFEDFGAKFVANDRKYKYGKVVTLETDKLRFQASWDRGEYFLRIAPSHAPLDWEGIDAALMVVNAKAPSTSYAENPISQAWSGLAGLAQVLGPQLPLIEKAFSPEQYAHTIQSIERIEGIARQEFVERWNKGVQFYRAHPEANSRNKNEPFQTLGLKDYPDS